MEMETVLAIAERYLPHAGDGNGHGGPQLLDKDSRYQNSLHDAAYEAGYARGHEAGFQTGYKEGFKDRDKALGTREKGPGTREQGTGNERAPGPRLLGLPCANCGAFFYSDEAHCPRCKTARARNAGNRE